jgi:3-phenylpropionate/trans-cinnamate dioxygenase ferredoxin subunit
MAKKIKWHRIASDADSLIFGQNNIAVVDCDGKQICVGRHNGAIYAFAYKCPHASGIMANGTIDALGNVVCPLHRYKFNIANGRNTSGEGYYLKTYALETRNDGIYAGIEESGFSLW